MTSFSDVDTTGDRNRPPKLMNVADFPNWKYRMEQYFNLVDSSLWQSVMYGTHRPSTTGADGVSIVDKRLEDYSESDKKLVDRDRRALAALSMALPNELIHIFKQYSSAKTMWEALIERYEGNVEARENRQDLLRKQYEQFVILKGETVGVMINRYTHLLSDLRSAAIDVSTEQINKKLLDALPNSWNMIIMMIKRTNNLKTMQIEELIGMIQSYNAGMNRDVYAETASPYVSLTNSALMSEVSNPMIQIAQSFNPSAFLGQVGTPSSSSSTPNPVQAQVQAPSVISSINQENLDLLCSFITCHEAFAAGNLSKSSLTSEEMDQIHPDDLEEMDLQWQMAMLAVRARKFFRRTGRKCFTDPRKTLDLTNQR